jgi:hypothetical protein
MHEEDAMTAKIFVVSCLLGLLVAPEMAWSARWSRGECLTAAKEKLGNPGLHRSVIQAAADRCVKYGPDAILNEKYAPEGSSNSRW